jgi:hypothetical protein
MVKSDDIFIPWGLHPVKPWVIEELKKRGEDYGLKNTPDKDGVKRSGVRTPWVRFFSNGIAPEDESLGLEGFLMGGTRGFNDSFGFNKEGETTIGYDANGKPHKSYAVNSFPNRPPPVIESVDAEIISGQSSPFSGMCRKVIVKWKAFSLDHLTYLTPYFLSPKVTCVVEWGWDNYNPVSLLTYDVQTLRKAFGNPKMIMEKTWNSNGNYDAHIGYVTEYNYKMTGNGVYECSTTIVSVAWLFEGQEYGNQTLKRIGKDGKEVKIESFKEFNKYSKWDNLEKKKNPPPVPRPSTYVPTYGTNTYGGVGMYSNQSYPGPEEESYPGSYGRVFEAFNDWGWNNRRWVRLDYFVEILNHFFEIKFGDVYVDKPENKDKNEKKLFTWSKINIDHVLISAHPGIKSIDPEIIVPNQYAPKYIYPQTKGKKASTGKLDGVQIENANYFEKFKKIQKVISDNKFTNDYDDIFKLVSGQITDQKYKGRSFPIFSSSELREEDKTDYQKNVGYCGYLKDLYISTEFIKRAVEENSTVKALLTSLLNKISAALSGIVELRIVPYNQDQKEVSVMDVKFCPVLDKEEISRLPRIIPGSSNHSFILSAGLDIKMSPEMAAQVVFTQGSAELKKKEEEEKKNKEQGNNKKSETGGTVPVTDADSFGRFVAGDRLAPKGTVSQNTQSNTQKQETKELTRNTDDEGFNIYNQDGVDYYLNEPSSVLMRQIIMEDEAPAAVYANTAIMPNTEFEFETLGIGGFTFLGMFTLDHVPYAYTWENAVWQISKIKQNITAGNWKTSISAQVRKVSTFVGQ